MIEQHWTRYRHQKNRKIEYDVEASGGGLQGRALHVREFQGEQCFRVKSIRNLLYKEEIHIPAYTLMPCKHFLEVYERV